jgi:hypothetical protein
MPLFFEEELLLLGLSLQVRLQKVDLEVENKGECVSRDQNEDQKHCSQPIT